MASRQLRDGHLMSYISSILQEKSSKARSSPIYVRHSRWLDFGNMVAPLMGACVAFHLHLTASNRIRGSGISHHPAFGYTPYTTF